MNLKFLDNEINKYKNKQKISFMWKVYTEKNILYSL